MGINKVDKRVLDRIVDNGALDLIAGLDRYEADNELSGEDQGLIAEIDRELRRAKKL